MLRGAEWYLATDVSDRRNGPTLMCQAVPDTRKNNRQQTSFAGTIRVNIYCKL